MRAVKTPQKFWQIKLMSEVKAPNCLAINFKLVSKVSQTQLQFLAVCGDTKTCFDVARFCCYCY